MFSAREQVLIDGIAGIEAILAKATPGDRVRIWRGTGKESVDSARARIEVFQLELAGKPIPICAGSSIVRQGKAIIVADTE